MLEAFMWLLVEAALLGTVALAVLVVVRRVRYERWVQARARQQLVPSPATGAWRAVAGRSAR